ncbi:hypothetical protein KW834_02320 [Pseudomonas sp. PDM29]|jgi:O-antigen/teichoic acid export membrane protein|uniref:hypothetical protein n=1 Tax=unclassified Pseudomonas TaxID=196821 RepID=UPI001C4946CB|nr:MULTISPECIES: hypothetical protein [unclassified Pseudomonas]MBV7523250.1 hypothetical protein [Pseudomonas sp. PDM29]
MRFERTHLKQIESLAATGMPGAYKVLIFFLIQHLYSTESLGNIASWISASQIIGFFTAIGWCALIVVRVAKADSHQSRLQALNNLTIMSLATLLFFTGTLFLIGKAFNLENTAQQICYWTIAWTSYQIPRHYFIALTQYRRALAMDLSIILLSMLSFATGSEVNASVHLALAMFVPGAIAFFTLQFGAKPKPPAFGFDIKGLEFGLINFLTGGISLSLIPLAAYFEGKEFAGTLSLFISITAISLLLPRAISLKYLPELSANVRNYEKFKKAISTMKQQITVCNLLSTFASVLIATFFIITSQAQSKYYLALTLTLLIIQNLISTNSLTDSNILMAHENSRSMLAVSSITSFSFFTLAIILCITTLKGVFLFLCLALTAITYYRASSLRKKTSHMSSSRSNTNTKNPHEQNT